jgi:hypothetical protein
VERHPGGLDLPGLRRARKAGFREAARVSCRAGIVAALALLAACNAIKLTYNNLDWLALWQVGRFVDLDPPQKALFDDRFREFWSWHRGTQLKLYVEDLQELAGKVDKPLSAQQVDDYVTRSSDHLARAMREAVPDTAKVLQTLDDQQAQELIANLAKKRAERRAESADLTADEIKGESEDQMVKNLKRWIGSLTRDEKARVHQWAQERQYAGTLWYQYQEAWGSAFTEVLGHRHDPDFTERLAVLFHEAKLPYGDDMKKVQAHNRHKWIELLADISAMLTPDQRKRLRDKLQELASDLTELSRQSHNATSQT